MSNDTQPAIKITSIWEPGLRIWHWANALSILLLLETSFLFDWHKELGLSKETSGLFKKTHWIVGLVFTGFFLYRFYLLFRGKTFSRARDLRIAEKGQSVMEVLRHEISIHKTPPRDRNGQPIEPPEPGHNRLGRFLYVPLLFILLPLQIVTGALWGSLNWGYWPVPALHTLDHATRKSIDDLLSNIHSTGMYIIVGIVVLHIGGVIMSELTFGTNLLSSMVHGKKNLPPQAVIEYEKILGEEQQAD
ncbi:MAG: cytochrome b/b6 domain-containing protein [Leptospirillum sp.]